MPGRPRPTPSCAARLERDALGDAEPWRGAWWPTVCRLAHEAHHRGDLPATATPGSIAELAALFIRSIGTHTEEPGGAAADGESGAARLARLWGITQPGMADRESG